MFVDSVSVFLPLADDSGGPGAWRHFKPQGAHEQPSGWKHCHPDRLGIEISSEDLCGSGAAQGVANVEVAPFYEPDSAVWAVLCADVLGALRYGHPKRLPFVHKPWAGEVSCSQGHSRCEAAVSRESGQKGWKAADDWEGAKSLLHNRNFKENRKKNVHWWEAFAGYCALSHQVLQCSFSVLAACPQTSNCLGAAAIPISRSCSGLTCPEHIGVWKPLKRGIRLRKREAGV